MNNRNYFWRTLPALSKLLFFIIFLVNISHLQAQNLNNINSADLTSINVDELTNAQIQEFVDRASSSGMTMGQLEAAALAKGMSNSEVMKLRRRIDALETETSTINIPDNSSLRSLDDINLSVREDIFQTSTPEKPEIYGRHLFNQKNLTFAPSVNIPTPKNYQLGPGDKILIEIYGASQESYQLIVSPEGRVKISNLAPIQLNGLSIEAATVLLKKRLYGIYSGMKGNNPNTFAQISLGDLRSITINIVGEVELPGTYTLSSLSTVFNALYLAGGPNEKGSFRKINVIRDNTVFRTIDLYDFLLGGISENNVRLQDQDIVFVSEYQSRITIDGEVKRPAIYETVENESLDNLLSFAGGFAEEAFRQKLTITRNTPTQKKILDVNQAEYEHSLLQNGDYVYVGKLLDRYENRISINGAVYREGEYELTEGLSLLGLIKNAEGLREDAYLPLASVYRLQENLKIKIIPIDLGSLINGNAEDILLQREDVVNISSVFDLEEVYNVRISGEIQQPGQFLYYDNMTVAELIRLAGGLKESASHARLEIARRIKDNIAEESKPQIAEVFSFHLSEDLSISNNGNSFKLEPYDIIFVRRSPGYETQQIVSIEGEVAFPGDYSRINKNERISDLIARAGGLSPEAYPKGATLYRRIEMDEQVRQRILEQLEKGSEDTLQLNTEGLLKEQAIGIDLPAILANPGSEYDLLLKDGDRLKIPIELQTVRLTGALLYPVTVKYDKGMRLSGYVSKAGGYTDNARKNKTYVLYANGSVDRTKSLMWIKNYPAIEPGAEIIVPLKAEKEKISPQAAISMSSAIASMALVLVTLIRIF